MGDSRTCSADSGLRPSNEGSSEKSGRARRGLPDVKRTTSGSQETRTSSGTLPRPLSLPCCLSTGNPGTSKSKDSGVISSFCRSRRHIYEWGVTCQESLVSPFGTKYGMTSVLGGSGDDADGD